MTKTNHSTPHLIAHSLQSLQGKVAFLFLISFVSLQTAFAADNETPDWEVKTLLGTVSSATPISSYIELILLFLYSLIGGITIIRIMMGAFRYIQAAGNPIAAKEAKETIQHAFTGLVLVLVAFLITDFFLGDQGLITTSTEGEGK